MALREAVAVRVDPAGTAGEVDRLSLARGPEAENRPSAIHAVVKNAVLQQVAHHGIEFGPVPLRRIQEYGHILSRVGELSQKIADRHRLVLS